MFPPGATGGREGRGAAWAAAVRWGAAYAVHDVREVYWLATAGWAPLGPRGSRRVRARRALRRYWAVRQAGNYAAALWLTVSLIVVGDAYFIAFHDIFVTAAEAFAQAFAEGWAAAVKAWTQAARPLVGRAWWDAFYGGPKGGPFGPRGV